MKAWTDNISDDVNKKEDWQQGRLDDDEALHNIFVMEDIIAGAEQGFMLPVAGQDGNWLREHEEKFMKRAESGDESMKRLLGEMEVMEVNGRKK